MCKLQVEAHRILAYSQAVSAMHAALPRHSSHQWFIKNVHFVPFKLVPQKKITQKYQILKSYKINN